MRHWRDRRGAAATGSVVAVMSEEDSSEYGFARVRVVGAKGEILDRFEFGSDRVEFDPDQPVGVASQDQMMAIAAGMYLLVDRGCAFRRISGELLGLMSAMILRNLPDVAS